jgi:hypothetical protein
MVGNITGYENLGDIGGRTDEIGTRTRDDCHPVYMGVPITGYAKTGVTKRIGHTSVEDRQTGIQHTDTANTRRAQVCITTKGLRVLQAQRGSERICRPTRGSIEIGVRHQKTGSHRHQAIGPRLGRTAGQQPVGRFEEKRVIRHQQIHLALGEPVYDLLGHLVTYANTLYLGVWVTQLKTNWIPLGGVLRSGALSDGIGKILDCGHNRIVRGFTRTEADPRSKDQ